MTPYPLDRHGPSVFQHQMNTSPLTFPPNEIPFPKPCIPCPKFTHTGTRASLPSSESPFQESGQTALSALLSHLGLRLQRNIVCSPPYSFTQLIGCLNGRLDHGSPRPAFVGLEGLLARTISNSSSKLLVVYFCSVKVEISRC
jgi:hypothetical protein